MLLALLTNYDQAGKSALSGTKTLAYSASLPVTKKKGFMILTPRRVDGVPKPKKEKERLWIKTNLSKTYRDK